MYQLYYKDREKIINSVGTTQPTSSPARSQHQSIENDKSQISRVLKEARSELVLSQQMQAIAAQKEIPRSLSAVHRRDVPVDVNVPKNLYFFSGNQPSLADMRNALRKNSFSHHQYKPQMETK